MTTCDWLHSWSRGLDSERSRDSSHLLTTATSRRRTHADTPRDILLPVPVYSTRWPLQRRHTQTRRTSSCARLDRKHLSRHVQVQVQILCGDAIGAPYYVVDIMVNVIHRGFGDSHKIRRLADPVTDLGRFEPQIIRVSDGH